MKIEHLWAMPVVAETYDGVLNDINGQHIIEADALSALDTAAPGPVDEGNAGGGTPGGNNSGDIFLAFSTANRGPIPQLAAARRSLETINDDLFDPIYMAATEAIEEAVVNAMLAAEDMTTLRPPGLVCRALDADRLSAFFKKG